MTPSGQPCSLGGCPGTYETREVVYSTRYRGAIVVAQDVPAEVCPICGDTLFTPETAEQLQRIVRERAQPVVEQAPVYQFA